MTVDISNPYRTGRMVVVKEEAIVDMFEEETSNRMLESRVAYINKGIVNFTTEEDEPS